MLFIPSENEFFSLLISLCRLSFHPSANRVENNSRNLTHKLVHCRTSFFRNDDDYDNSLLCDEKNNKWKIQLTRRMWQTNESRARLLLDFHSISTCSHHHHWTWCDVFLCRSSHISLQARLFNLHLCYRFFKERKKTSTFPGLIPSWKFPVPEKIHPSSKEREEWWKIHFSLLPYWSLHDTDREKKFLSLLAPNFKQICVAECLVGVGTELPKRSTANFLAKLEHVLRVLSPYAVLV